MRRQKYGQLRLKTKSNSIGRCRQSKESMGKRESAGLNPGFDGFDIEFAGLNPKFGKSNLQFAEFNLEHGRFDLQFAESNVEPGELNLESAEFDFQFARSDLECGKFVLQDVRLRSHAFYARRFNAWKPGKPGADKGK